MRWITAQQLETWARGIGSRTELPHIVSDLIRASSPSIGSIRFPSGDKGQTRGFDGYLDSDVEVTNVPLGQSIWELGTEPDYLGKAVREYEKLTKAIPAEQLLETTFVFVTPWTWNRTDQRLNSWVADRKAEGLWKDVRFIDGPMLETWLEQRPAVAAWHASNTLQLRPQNEGVRSTSEFWADFSGRYEPRLTEEVLVCERDDIRTNLVGLLLGRPDKISMSADSPDEVIAFAIACIRKADPEVRLFLEARTLVVDQLSAGRYFLNDRDLVFLLRNDAAFSPLQFADKGPALVPLGRQQKSGAAIALPRQSGQGMGMAMESMGLGRDQAITLARGSGRSLSALARQIPSGACEPPVWVSSGSVLLPAILVGAWDAGNDADKAVVTALAGSDDYYHFEAVLRPFASQLDPAFDHEGLVWKVRAPMDAFIYIGSLVGPEHLGPLKDAMTAVFSHVEKDANPGGELYSPTRDQTRHSDWLREGLSTTLLLIAVWEEQAGLNLGVGAGQAFADNLIENLPGLKDDHRLLASLRNQLPLLAEASPGPLLSALEFMLEGEATRISGIFQEKAGFLTPISQHVGVLWALETLAWDPQYFRRAVHVLARLADLDPGGNSGNRPGNSLAEIFVPWVVNTNASAQLRLTALKEIAYEFPDVGWKLLQSLMPSMHGSSTTTYRPMLRDAGKANERSVTYADYWQFERELIKIVLSVADTNPTRWGELVDRIGLLPPTERQLAIDGLRVTLTASTGEDRQKLWEKVRDEVFRHERYSHAQWALPAGEIAPLKQLSEDFAPADPIIQIAWAFDSWTIDGSHDISISNKKRAEMLTTLLAGRQVNDFMRLVQKTKLPSLIVEALALSDFEAEFVIQLATESLSEFGTSDLSIGMSALVRQKIGQLGAAEWLADILQQRPELEPTAGRLLLGWPNDSSTWTVVRRFGNHMSLDYWSIKNPTRMVGSKFELLRALSYFLRAGRASSALQLIFDRIGEIPTTSILRILDQLIGEVNAQPQTMDTMGQYYLENVFKELDKRDDITLEKMAEYEYKFFYALEHSNRPFHLHKIMISNANFFHSILRNVFRGDGDEVREATDDEKARARFSYKLLSGISEIPGLNNGEIDASFLLKWVDEVHNLGIAHHRKDITDQYIGHVLAHSPFGADGAWPHESVRNVIEHMKSPHLETGLQVERFNMRGVHSRSMYVGGEQERALAADYRSYAITAQAWPRTASMLMQVSDSWMRDAAREDERAAQDRLRS